MKVFLRAAAIAAFVFLQTNLASAHFLFVRIGVHAEAGRAVEVFFSERAEAGDPKFVGKIAQTKLWMQTKPGEFQALKLRKATDRLRAFLPASGTTSVVGECTYGVLKRKVSFLLQYFPKAISGAPEDLNALELRKELPLEIQSEISGGEIALVLVHNGKPVPNAKFTTVDDDLGNEEITADAKGRAVWKPSDRGHYCVYANVTVNESGEHAGRSYSEIRRFATLAFRWPLGDTSADAEAVKMFERAIAARAGWQNFPGFTANITGNVDGRDFEGTVKANADGTVAIKLDEESANEWVQDQLDSIVLHRNAREGGRRSKPVLRFAEEDDTHPLGRLLTFEGGHFASSYRVRDNQLTMVNRNFGTQNMTITIIENDKTAEGKFLPRSYVVRYWDAKDGQLLKTQSFRNRWKRVGNFDLPSALTVTTASGSGLTVRHMELSQHKLLD